MYGNFIHKHKGCAAELYACLWLMDKGYEVFRNISAHGDCDLIAMKGQEIIKIDVKTASNDGRKSFPVTTAAHDEKNIKILVVCADGTVRGFSDAKFIHRGKKIPCIYCKAEFIPKRANHKYCNALCRGNYWYNK